ncbi:MAG: hypothetical protein LBR32_08485, partial [Propionibacteriaceae bacterium]|nr:hypothetical protein [Propionibacteriaceae bacterium]
MSAGTEGGAAEAVPEAAASSPLLQAAKVGAVLSAQQSDSPCQANSQATLKACILAAPTNGTLYEIKVTGSFIFSDPLTIGAGQNVRISATSSEVLVQAANSASAGSLPVAGFVIAGGGALAIADLDYMGGDSLTPLIDFGDGGGTLVLESGALLRKTTPGGTGGASRPTAPSGSQTIKVQAGAKIDNNDALGNGGGIYAVGTSDAPVVVEIYGIVT